MMVEKLLIPGSIPQLVRRHTSRKNIDAYFPLELSSLVVIVVVTKDKKCFAMEWL